MGNCRYLKSRFEAPTSDSVSPGELARLKRMRLTRLEEVQHDGYTEDAEEAFRRWTSWKGPVTLHFGSRGSQGSSLPKNQHRRAAMIFLSIGLVGMCFASRSCWSCVAGIRKIKDTTAMELQMQLHILGACGRFNFLGMGSACAAVIVFVSLMMQMIAVRLSDASNNGGNRARELYKQFPRWCLEQHLLVKVFDSVGLSPSSRREDEDHGIRGEIYDAEFYEEAGLEMPEFWCFVWVRQEGGEEVVCDGSHDWDERDGWGRSKQPRMVRLSNQRKFDDSETSVVGCAAGLLRDDSGLPVLWVELLDTRAETLPPPSDSKRQATNLSFVAMFSYQTNEAGADEIAGPQEAAHECLKKQMIPRQFIARRSHVWLNLGPRDAWECLSAALAFTAFLIILVEIAFALLHPHGTFLTKCSEILNAPCIYLNTRQRISEPSLVFRHAIGIIAAAIGGGSALIAVLCLRVANEVDLGSDVGVCAYLRASHYTIRVLVRLAKIAFGGIHACCVVACCKRSRRKNNPSNDVG